ncbi:eukaryotic translation initiation factor 2-alpha kinase 3-like [Panonychus citri]|uniref:eukaryotic translation initiation factor 2-alpha kinase 3-like n=1 Tax=Panonychus citri TaxID=50023 RepID=UPI00230812F5|nr:eukaryotic translation initiation factor 2-alpha kinase 3-like [Panonychus citri]
MKTMVKFIFFLLFTLITLIGFTFSSDGIADCSSVKQASLRKLMNQADCYIVSTLDGKVTALDLNDNGKILWSYSTDDDGLLQSTIGDFQFISDAIYFKLVPALDGSLYKLNQQYNIIEPVPLNADILLKSSFKLGDDLLINGGKEVRTFAFDLFSGDLIYSCGLADCTNTPRGSRDDDSNETIILIRQLRQKVKAVDPRSGVEQWKFSVGENNAQLLSKTDDCHLFDDVGSQSTSERTDEKLSISIADGLIRMQARRENRLLWTQNLESPIVGMWLYQNGKLDNVDLFRHDLTSSESLYKKPILYIGSHNNQYYIQHSNAIRDRYREIGKTFYSQSSSSSSIHNLDHHHHHHHLHPFIPQIEWQSNPENGNDLQIIPSGSRELIIPTQGQFIFMKSDDTKTQCYPPSNVEDNLTLVNLSAEDYFNGTQSPGDSIEQIIIISLWHWWKEVAIISICLAILINFAYSYFRRHVIKKVFLKLPSEEDDGVFCRVNRSPRSSECTDDNRSTNSTSPSTPTLSLQQPISLDDSPAATIRPNSLPNGVTFVNYISRYITDFEPICCLGKGGFGVVFQARNRIDDCHYAVKRIDLPVQQSARDKVMREVRALANLEHHGIVRYYNSWLEVPPLGWQEEADSALIIDKSSYWGSDPNSAKSQLKPNKQSSSSLSSSSSSSPPINQQWPKNRKDLDNFSFGNNRNNDDDDDSYVVFQNNTKSSVNNNHKTGESESANQKNHHNNQENTNKQLDESENKGVNFVSKQQQSQRAYLYIQMQLCQKETLREWLKTHKEREKVPILEYFIQIVEAVDYVHSKKLMHRDLKPSNIFFAMDGCVKIGDFGLVTGIASDFFGTQGGDTPSNETPHSQKHQHKGRHTDQVGTKLYMSPEQIAGSSYSNKVDIYSLGVIFFEMLMPFDTEMERIKTLSSIKEGLFPNKFKTNQPKECRLICKLLSCDPDERPLASEILNDPVFFDAENELIIERIPRKRTLSSSKTY